MSGLFHVTISHQFYGHKPVTASELQAAINEPIFPPTKVVKVENIGSTVDAGALKQRWQKTEDEEFLHFQKMRQLGYGSLSLCFLLLFISTMKFRKWVIDGKLKNRRLLQSSIPLSLQALIFIVPFLFPMSQAEWSSYLYDVSPAVLVVWIYELVIYRK